MLRRDWSSDVCSSDLVWAQGTELTGKVREVSASADPATRTYPVKVALDTREPPVLGATVYVQPQGLAASGVQVIKLPTSALRQEGKDSAVWVLDKASMTVKSQTIQIATADGNDAVVAAGLQPGMLVVSAGVHVLSPGQKVTIYQPKVPVAQAPPAKSATNSIASVAAAASLAPAAK
jgi:multidrug efflux pump subunit AcrA (membrane-fusion protein)